MGKKLSAPPEHPNTRKLLGTFTAPSGLAIGDPYSDRRVADARHKGKGTAAGLWRGADARTIQCAPGTFKLAPFLFANFDAKGKEPYKEAIKYRERFKTDDTRPRGAPKNGFMSTDFPKRDEYTNTIRTEQTRESMRREGRVATSNQRATDERMRTSGVRPATAGPSRDLNKVNLYDLVFRIPVTDLHMMRDDRQGKSFYTGLRQKQKLMDAGTYKELKPKIIEGHAWVHVTMPNGEHRQMLVNEERKVVSKRPMSAHI